MQPDVVRQPYIVHSGKLVPADFEARSHLNTIAPGTQVDVVIYKREPDVPFSRLVYKTFAQVGAAMKWRARNVRGWLAANTGRADLVRWPPGVEKGLFVPWGTGPTDMSQAELEAFWDDARELIRSQILPHIDAAEAEELRRRIDDLWNVS